MTSSPATDTIVKSGSGPFRFGLIGHGAIGRRVRAVLADSAPDIACAGLLLRPNSANAGTTDLPVAHDAAALAALRPDAVLECAGHVALATHGPGLLAAGIDLIIASVGALADARLHATLLAAAQAGGARLILPPGAVGGLDALGAMRLAGPIRVLYRSRKPPIAWMGTPAEGLVDLATLATAAVFYRGSARHAARDYPKNANVAATIALAGAGMDATEVALIADPAVRTNIHEIEASGPTGSMMVRLDGLPDPENPKTSMLTAYSLAQTLLHRAARG